MPKPESGKVIPPIDPQAAQAALAADDGTPGGAAQQAAGAVAKSQAEAQDKQPAEQKKTWFGFKILDAAGKPVKNERCKLTMPDGTEKTMKTDGAGVIKVEDVDPGKPVSVRLVDRYDYEWGFNRVDDAL